MPLNTPTPRASIIILVTIFTLLAVVFAPVTSAFPTSASAATATPAGNVSPVPATPTATGPLSPGQSNTKASTSGPDTKPANTADPNTHPKVGPLLGDIPADTDSGLSTASTSSVSGSASDMHVAVEPKEGATGEVASLIARYGSIDARIEGRITATIPAAKLTDLANESTISRIERPMAGTPLDISNTGGEDEINATKLHKYSDSDFSGDGTTVAVLDLQSFSENNNIYSDQVVDRINTDDGPSDSHGTKTAEIVAETAPKANLILVKVNSYTDLVNRIDYLRTETETDVISISIGYTNVGPLDGSSAVDTEIREFADDGGIFVPSMGNQADGKHWYGTYNDPDNDNYIEVGDGTNLIDVGVNSGLSAVFLQWDDYDTLGTSDEDYALQVVNGDTGKVIRESDNTQAGPGTNPPEEGIWVSSTDTDPHIRIKYNGGDRDAQLFLTSFANTFTPSSQRSSVLIPATSPDALSVGAYGPAGTDGPNTVESFSSRGPTSDGRRKPDIVAPDGISINGDRSLQYGTSFAAPHAAGIAAIAKAEHPDLTPSAFKSQAKDTATSVQDDEPNNVSGHGLINGTGILSRVETAQPTINSYTVTDNEDGDNVVTADDEVTFEAAVTDRFLATVEVDATAYGMGTVELSDENNDGTYTYTGTVGADPTAGESETTLIATDRASNSARATASSVAVSSQVTDLSVTNGPLNPTTNTIKITGKVDSTANIAFKFTDAEGEYDTVTKSVSTTDFSVEIDPTTLSLTSGNGKLDEGSVTLEADQAESFGSAEQSTTFTIDRTAPTIDSYTVTDTEDGDGLVSSGDEIRFAAEVTGADTVTVDAHAYNMGKLTLSDENDDGTYTYIGTVGSDATDGASETTLTATDLASNSARTTASTVRVDKSGETTELSVTNTPLNPETDAIEITGTAETVSPVTFKITDAEGTYETVTKSITSTDFAVTVDLASLSGKNGQFAEGTGTLEADQSSTFRRTEQTTSFEIDRTSPTVSVDSPTGLTVQSGDTVDITYTATDNNGIQSTDVALVDPDGDTVVTTTETTVSSSQPTTASLTVPPKTADGTYDITIIAHDTADNTQTKIFTDRVTVDDKVQTISADSTVTNGPLTVTGTADTGKEIHFTLTGPDGETDTIRTAPRSRYYELPLGISDRLADGTLTIDARQGSPDSESEATLNDVSLDRTPPTVTIESVSTPTEPTMAGREVSVSYTATDTNGHGLADIGLQLKADDGNTVDGTYSTPADPTSGNSETAQFTIPSTMADGTYDVVVTATDKASNTNSKTIEDAVTIDKNQLTALSPKRVPAVFNDSATVEVAGNMGSPTGIIYQLEQGSDTDTVTDTVSSSSFDSSIDLSAIRFRPSEGSLNINAKETNGNGAGNTDNGFEHAEASLATSIDTTPPTVTVGNVDTMTVTSGETITATYTSDDTNDHGLRGGVVKLVRESDGTVVTTQPVDSLTDKQRTETTVRVPNTENGDYRIRVVSNDTAYNTGKASSDPISVANTVRETTVTSPASGVVGNTGTVTLAGSVDAVGDISFQLTDGSDTATTTRSVSTTEYSTTIDLGTLSPSGGDGTFAAGNTVTINSDYGSSYKTADSSATVTIDSTDPTASISSPSATTVPQGASVDISFKLTDIGQTTPASATVKLRNDGTILTSRTVQDVNEDESVTATLSIPSDATETTYDIVIETTDAAGNTDLRAGTKSDAVTVESTTTETENTGGGGAGGGGAGGGGGGGAGGGGGGSAGGGGSIPAPQPDPTTPEDTEPTEESESDEEPSETPDTDDNTETDVDNERTDTTQPTEMSRSVTGDVEITHRNKSTVESVVTFGTDSTAAGVSQSDSQADTDVFGQGNRPVLLSSAGQETGGLDQDRRVPRRVRAEILANVASDDRSIVAETLTIDATTAKQRYTASISATTNVSYPSETGDLGDNATAAPADTGAVNTATQHGGTPSEKTIGAIAVGHSVSNDDVDAASFTVGVSQSKLAQRNMSTDDVVLYRYHGGDWTRLKTNYIGSNGTTERFTAISPGLSVFAIGAANGSSEAIDSTEINQTRVFENDGVAINATVENTGTAEQVYTVTFDVGGETTNRSVAVPGGETRTVTHVTTIGNNVGGVSRDVYINGMFAGTIEIASLSSVSGSVGSTQPPATDASTRTPKPVPTETQTPAETLASSGNPGFILLIALVSFAVAVVSLTLRDE